jgi:catechol 2,3-dioxygenase-like lactoylglutathione lyase family enzyme
MIKGIRHVGLVVADLNEAKKFWTEVMGFILVREMDEFGPHIDNMMGLSGVSVLTAKLRSPDGNLLELLHFKSHPSDSIWRGKPYSVGFTHIALTVESLDEFIPKLIESGVTFPDQPQLSPDGRVRVVYASCADGVLIELVENQ